MPAPRPILSYSPPRLETGKLTIASSLKDCCSLTAKSDPVPFDTGIGLIRLNPAARASALSLQIVGMSRGSECPSPGAVPRTVARGRAMPCPGSMEPEPGDVVRLAERLGASRTSSRLRYKGEPPRRLPWREEPPSRHEAPRRQKITGYTVSMKPTTWTAVEIKARSGGMKTQLEAMSVAQKPSDAASQTTWAAKIFEVFIDLLTLAILAGFVLGQHSSAACINVDEFLDVC